MARARPTAARLAGDAGACAAENPRPTLLRADSDPRRPAYSAHTAQATDGGHQRRHPELHMQQLAATTRLGVKKKIYPN